MATTKIEDRSWIRRLVWPLLIVTLILVLAVIALRIFITTASGARFIEKQVNNRSFGSIESVKISGLSGDPLSNIYVEYLEVRDKQGIWLKANDLHLKWKPTAYLSNHFWVEKLAIQNTEIIRRPELNAAKAGSAAPRVTLESLTLKTINLDESLMGTALRLQTTGQYTAQPHGEISAKLNAVRLDEPGDSLTLDFLSLKSGKMTGLFNVNGAPGGAISTLLRAPEGAEVSGNGALHGTRDAGEGDIKISFGQAASVFATTRWTPAELEANARIDLDNWPAFDVARRNLGPAIQSRIHIDRNAMQRPFAATLNGSGLSLDASGILPENGFFPTTTQVDLEAPNLRTFLSLPEGYDVGQTKMSGRVELRKPYSFDGRISAKKIFTPYGSTPQISGPVKISQTEQNRYILNNELVLSDAKTHPNLPFDPAARTLLKSIVEFDTEQSRLSAKSFDLTSGANHIMGQGSLSMGAQSVSFSGKAALKLKPMAQVPSGILKTDFEFTRSPAAPLALRADGSFELETPLITPLQELIGRQLIFQTHIQPIQGGVIMSDSSLAGDNIKAAIEGVLNEQLNVKGEAILSAPLNLSLLQITGGAEGSFTLSGPRDAPELRIDATAGTVTAQGYAIQNARLRSEVSNLLRAPAGPLQIDGDTKYGRLTASTKLASVPGAYIAENISITLGQLLAEGDLRLPKDRVVVGEMNVRLPETNGEDHFARAKLSLSNSSGNQAISVSAEAKKISVAGFQLETASAKASGTLSELEGRLDVQGRREDALVSREIKLDSPFTLSRKPEQTYRFSSAPTASYGDLKISTRSPITASYSAGEVSLKAPLTIYDGLIDVFYSRTQAGENLQLEAKKLPVTLFPMPGNLADTLGRISVDLNLSTAGPEPLRGEATFTLQDWRGFDVEKGRGLNGTIKTTLNDAAANVILTANSLVGFKSEGQLRVPLRAAANLTALRMDMDAPIIGTYSASGAASSIFSLFTPSDAELGGSVAANVNIAGSVNSPQVQGQARVNDISLEIPELGTQIRKGRAAVNFTNETFSVTDLFSSDSRDGTLVGDGKFKLGEMGRPLGELKIEAKNFRALDRRDVEAKVNGSLTFVSNAKDSTLSGDVTIDEAEITQFISGNVGVIEIDVEEINLPDQRMPSSEYAPKTPVKLAIHVRAPRRIIIRSRGLDVEMSADTNIQGTLAEPLFYGEAKVLRGGYKLAGKTLDFETGTIKFNGELENAKIDFKAITETQNLDASITIKGTVEAPEIELTSEPERPQDEILSALLFGQSATELSTVEAAQLAGALAQFSGRGGGFDLLGGLRDALGIGQLSVNFNSDGNAQLVGGRYLAKNVYMQIFSGVGPDQTGAMIDWEIRKNIALRSRIRADNDQALSLKWKRDF